MRAYAARAAHDTQRSKRSEPAVTTPSSMAHRPPGAVVRTLLAGAGMRGLAPSRRPPTPGARALFESRFAQDFSHVRVHAAERASSAPIAIGRTDDASEREAEATADAISQGGTASLPQPLPRSVGGSLWSGPAGASIRPAGASAACSAVARASAFPAGPGHRFSIPPSQWVRIKPAPLAPKLVKLYALVNELADSELARRRGGAR
jgi:hypothetical protein